ncbi:MAG: rhodanese-like domain-containing protein [Deltaproteobacteria bacterium]|jgi:rhodanese-related sulfurtransferase
MKKKIRLFTSGMTLVLLFGMAGSAMATWSTKELDNEKIAVNFQREVERGNYKVVTTDELKKWMDQKKPMLVVDTMPFEESYRKEHLPGGVNFVLPIPEMTSIDEKTKAELVKLLGPDKSRLIVFYCGFTKCTRSHNGALWAIKLGYKNVYRYPGGIKGWTEAGFQVEKGK